MLYRESGGNPFYIEQLARSATVEPSASADASIARDGRINSAAVIAAIREELVGGLDARRAARQAAAVAGESFEPELVGAIAEPDPRATLAGA